MEAHCAIHSGDIPCRLSANKQTADLILSICLNAVHQSPIHDLRQRKPWPSNRPLHIGGEGAFTSPPEL